MNAGAAPEPDARDRRDAKRAIRAEVRARRAERTPAQISQLADRLARVGKNQPELARARCVAGYQALPGEPDVGPLLAALAEATEATILLPRIATTKAGEPTLTWGRHTPGDPLAPGNPSPWGVQVLEPAGPELDLAEADLLLVPALAVDRHGHRLGQGGGYYDRTLAGLAAHRPFVVAVVYDEEIYPRVPTQPHDAVVDACLTPTRYLRCREP